MKKNFLEKIIDPEAWYKETIMLGSIFNAMQDAIMDPVLVPAIRLNAGNLLLERNSSRSLAAKTPRMPPPSMLKITNCCMFNLFCNMHIVDGKKIFCSQKSAIVCRAHMKNHRFGIFFVM